MKKPHEHVDEFPEEHVRASIQSGIVQAKERVDHKKRSRPKYRMKSGKRKMLYAIGTVIAIFGILVGSSYYSPTLASSLSKIPIIGSVFGDSDLIGLQQAQKKGLTIKIGETETVNGISVTLDEVLYDQNNITIGLLIESDKDLGDYYFGAGMDFTIDGSFPDGASGSYGEDSRSGTTKTAIQEITVTEEMPEAFELGLILQGQNGETWHFSTPIQKVTDITNIPIQHTQTVDGVGLNVTEFSYGDTGASVSFQSTEDAALADEDRDRASYIEFKLEDQDGNEIESHSGGVQGERTDGKMVYTSNKQFDPIDPGVTEVTITPYLALPDEGGGIEIDENGEEKELEYHGDSLEPIEFESFKVKIID